ncbi:MDIS1-interacting receptor like kinase 2 [Vitis vinifera]|uniref:MDIS1-interacting receptor like kinase 2 n=1 Tax=Vitis vinifera TaxID=29760 RepID=A0A438JV80_VITVI|nr:MDIS1-interacting receptor like kinase 2 [Vitis vinifera]
MNLASSYNQEQSFLILATTSGDEYWVILEELGQWGCLSPEVASLKNLRVVKLSYNHFLNGKILEEIGNLTKLKHLSLQGNKFSGGIPTSVLNLKELEVLDLSRNDLSMEILAGIGNSSNIFCLSLRNNKLTGGIPWSMEKLRKLETLDLENNSLTGEIPSWLFDLDGLKDLFLGGNHLREIPHWISTLKRLVSLVLSENQLQGEFSQWLVEMKLLGEILSDDELTGSLSTCLFSQSRMLMLALSRNRFFGELPENIGDAKELRILMLAGNNFSGLIPPSISQIPELLWLDLSGNKLSGNAFPEFDPQGRLTYIDFSSNEFSQPHFLEKSKFLHWVETSFLGQQYSTNLQILDVSKNNLTGGIPEGFGNFTGMIETPDFPASFFPTSFSINSISYVVVVAPSERYEGEVSQELNYLIVNWNKSKQGLSTHNLDIYSLLDLSNNQLSGKTQPLWVLLRL